MTQAVKLAQLGSPGISTGFKNRIINGAMVIDQRNAGASVTANGGFYLDRWEVEVSQSSKLSIQQQTSVVPTGFNYAIALTSLSSYSVGSSEIFNLKHIVEGFNCADFGWGTANAKTATLSFWVRSSLTGTFGGAFQNGDNDRSYPFSYTISAANTWEQKTITVAGDTTGTWGKTNGRGIQIRFSLGAGSTFQGTANAWVGSNIQSVTGATSVVGTNGATFYITGVQLEVGTTATDFEYKPYGTELQLCQRYFSKNIPVTTAPVNGATSFYESGMTMYSSTSGEIAMNYPVPMRASPTITVYRSGNGSADGKWIIYYSGAWNNANTTAAAADSAVFYLNIQSTSSLTAGNSYLVNGIWTASAEL